MIQHTKICRLELNVQFEICGMIGQKPSLDHALGSILEILSRTLSLKRATVTPKDPETGMLKIRASHNLSPEEKQQSFAYLKRA
jgi:Nif-specific regulatory protein